MSNTRQLLLVAENAAIALEKSKAAVEAARAELEAAKHLVEEAKATLDEAYARLEEAGVPKAKARKVVEEIIGALAQIGIDLGGEGAVAPAATSVEPRQPVQRQPRRSKKETATEASGEGSEGEEVAPATAIVPPAEAPAAVLEIVPVTEAIPAAPEALPVEAPAAPVVVDPAPAADVTEEGDSEAYRDEAVEAARAELEVAKHLIEEAQTTLESLEETDGDIIGEEIPDHVDLFGEANAEEAAEAADVPVEAEATAPVTPPTPAATSSAATDAEAAPSAGFRRPSFLGRKA